MDVATCSSICVENSYTDSIAAATADSNIQQSDISQTNELTNGDILVVTSTPQMSQESEDHEVRLLILILLAYFVTIGSR